MITNNPANFNPNQLNKPGLYVVIEPPPGYIQAPASNYIFAEGTAAWGPKYTVLCGSLDQVVQTIGGKVAASYADVHDLPTACEVMFQQTQSSTGGIPSGIGIYVKRATDGTDVAATGILLDTTSANEVAQLGGSTQTGDEITITIHNSNLTGGQKAVQYTVVDGDTSLSVLATSLATAISADSDLSALGFTATPSGTQVQMSMPANKGLTTYTKSVTGTSPKETVALSPAPLTGLTLTAKYTGSLGDSIQTSITAGTKTNTFNLTIVPPAKLQAELYAGLPGGTAFWAAAADAINHGQGVLRGPSQLLVASNPSGSAAGPALQTVNLSGGTDGRSGVDAADFIGSSSESPPTGIYQMQALKTAPSVAVCVGLTDNTVFATIQALVDSIAVYSLLSFPTGTSLTTAMTTLRSLAIDTPNISWCKDWIYWYDSYTGKRKLVDPAVFFAGRIAALSPEQSPLNKELYGVIGTEFINSLDQFQYYSDTDIGTMQDAGILVATNNPPGGNYWGFPHGSNCCSDAPRHFIEYSRLTNWVAHTLDSTMGKFLGQLQSTRLDDPWRAQVKVSLDTFFEDLKQAFQIDKYKNICDKTNNSDSSIAQHFGYADCYARYLSSVQKFIIRFTGGTTVDISVTTISEAEAAKIGV